MKIIAFYLPQFHSIPENDQWWGKGFTEWTNVKKAKPLYRGHYQPRIPLDENYYNLLDPGVMRWQVDLARKYGVYGFCFYHYWFDGHMLLEKPVDMYLENKDLDLSYCLSWANEDWTNAWAGKDTKTLITQNYGDEDEWARHMEYLLPHFEDNRYIHFDNKPLLIIYRPEIIPQLNRMLDFMNDYARTRGHKGISFAYQNVHFDLIEGADKSKFELNIEYQPTYALAADRSEKEIAGDARKETLKGYLRRSAFAEHLRAFRNTRLYYYLRDLKRIKTYDYDTMWRRVLEREPADSKCVPGAFVDWDNSPRKGNLGFVFQGATPEKFRKYLTVQIQRARKIYNKDMIFLFAWNEWAEGGYMEPDSRFGYGYLEALKRALDDANNECTE